MYGLLITFESEAALDDLAEPFAEYATALNQMPGLLNKAWLRDEMTLGGFHLFASKADADGYLASDLAQGLMATDGFDNFEARGFEVLGALSAMTGVGELQSLAG